ncbi:TolC family protein [Kordia algicida OT-1]|uniref:Putative outer membrane lipoprotein n=1 Tax=Kordia algicida OT-1 TaxID=391587 RepID=A9E3G9_9FLAO|nr:TolC family protein [Kordia algicida]EDP95509.1 putative outer membrane lipoprotein precursor [Kordia algicida OT-1]
MNKQIFTYLLILFLGNSIVVNAQDVLTLNEALQLAIENNVDVAKDKNNEASTRNDKTRAYLSLLPSVNASGNLFESTGTNFDQLTGTLRTETGQYVNASITASWDILNVLNKLSDLKLTKYNNESQKAQLAYTKDFVSLNVVGRYLETLQAIKQDEILSKFCDVQEIQVKRTQELIKVGSLPGQDFYTQNAELSRLKSSREDNLNVLNSKKNELMLLLRMNPAEEIELEKNLEAVIISGDVNIDSLYQIALMNRKDYKQLEAQSLANKYQVSLQRAAYIPSLSLYYDYGSRYSSFQARTFNQQFLKDNITNTIGLSVNIPVFNGMSTRNRVYKAKQDYQNSELDVVQIKNNIYVELKNLLNTISANKKKVIYREDQTESAKRAYELEKERYYLGQGNPLDLGIAQRNYIEASLLLNQINYQLMYNRYELLFLTGSIDSLL